MTCHHNFKLTINSLFIVALAASIAAYSHLQPVQETEYFDVRPTQEHISYLYCPGLMATEMVMGRYCPQFTAVTGEKFTFKAGGHILGAPHSAVVFPEIDLRKPGYFTFNPITAYLNRIRSDLYPLLSRIFQDKYQFDVQENPKSDLSVINYSFNFGQANAGQKKDIQALHTAYHDHLDMFEDTGIVAFGDSRGATALFNLSLITNQSTLKRQS